jgi:hypothetical protein
MIPSDRTELRVDERAGVFLIDGWSGESSAPPFPARKPKKRGPFHDVPVIAMAIAERLG